MTKFKKLFVTLLVAMVLFASVATSASAANGYYSKNVNNIFDYTVVGTTYQYPTHIVSGMAFIEPAETNHTYSCYVEIHMYDSDSQDNLMDRDDGTLSVSAVYVPGSDISNIVHVTVESEYDCDNGTYVPNLPTIITFNSNDL